MKLSENTKEGFFFSEYIPSRIPLPPDTTLRLQFASVHFYRYHHHHRHRHRHHVIIITTSIIVSDSSTKNHQTPRLHLPRSTFPGVTSGAEVGGRGAEVKARGFWQNHSANQTLNLDTLHNFTFCTRPSDFSPLTFVKFVEL